MHKVLVYIAAFTLFLIGFLVPEALSEGFFSFSHRGNIGIEVDCGGQDCIRAGVEDVGAALGGSGIETEKNISQAIQDVVKAFLRFLSLIAVIYIIGAGAYLIFGSANDETITKVRKIIFYVILGIIIIWIAYWIVALVITTLSGRGQVTWRPQEVHAQTQIRSVDFESYANKIKGMRTQIRGEYNPDVTAELNTLIDGAYQHLPDGDQYFENKNLYEEVKKRITEYDTTKQSLAQGALGIALDDFFDDIYAPKINGTIVASPKEGSAPLSVTLDARDVSDESGHIIGENNYIWWMKDSNAGPQVIGRGKTINHTFQTQGNYTIFLTINSDSKNSKGFTDVISFEDSVTVEANAEDIRFYINFNDQLISLEDTVKVPTSEAAAGIVIDASGTFVPDGYKIVLSEWDLGNGRKVPLEGPPQVEYVTYEEGSYNLRLTITRNDGKEITKRIKLIVGDPIANIFASKTLIHRGETINFKANKLASDNTTYTWEIREVGNPLPIHIDQGPVLSYPFMHIGRYQVMLISEKFDGSRDQDTRTITVASQSPVAHFSFRSVSSQMPNTIILDASRSYDPDLEDESTLSYSWFIDGTPVLLDNGERNGSRGTYTFAERGTYNVTLTIQDAEGKIANSTQDITIDSTLFIDLETKPLVAKRGEEVAFIATSSKEAESFSWEFGDKGVDTTTTGEVTHAYRLSGRYDVRVQVSDQFGQTNRLKKVLYVVDAEEPLSIIDSNSGSIFSEVEEGACVGQEALVTDRLNGVFLSGERSVNSSGRNDDLTYFWRIGLNETAAEKRFEYIFDEIGCHEVQLTVTDTRNGKSHTSSQFVKVRNLPPEFSDMTINIDNVDMDPMTIRLALGGAEDPDGVIRSYTWYYFTDFDKNPQGFRVTTTPNTVFVLPKITGRYKFAVVLEDSNGLKVDSGDIRQTEYSTPDLFVNQNLSTPIINFDVGNPEVLLGEDSILTANVKNALGQDIQDRSDFRWDFDGDGFYDLKTTKNTTTYRYTLPGEYNPKVKVTHRGISSSKHGTIRVENRLEPKINAYVVGNTVIAHNTTTGVYKGVKWKNNNKIISDNQDYVVFTPEKFPTTLTLDVSDGRQEQSTSTQLDKNFKNKARILKEGEELVAIVNTTSNPDEPLINPDDITIEDPNDALFIYLAESSEDTHRYHIDRDTSLDSDLNGDPADDVDNRSSGSFTTGRPFRLELGKEHKQNVKITLVGHDEEVLATHEIEITQNYIDAPIFNEPIDTQEIELSDQDKLRVNKLTQLIENAPQEQQHQLNKYVELLLDEWYDPAAKADTLFRMHQFINENGQAAPELMAEIQKQIDAIYAEGQEDISEKDLAKKLITDFVPKSHPEYTRIFGNTQTGEPGWIEGFVDDPAYLADNVSFAEKIWKSISFDTTISDEKKQVIYDKLGVLVGQPLDEAIENAEKPKDVKNGDSSDSESGGTLGKIFKWILLILSGIIMILAAVFGIRFVLNRRGQAESSDPFAAVESSSEQTTTQEPTQDGSDTPDWLKESSDTPSASEPQESTESDTPDWLKDANEENTQEPQALSTNESETPDWLKENTPDEQASEPVPTQESEASTQTQEPTTSEAQDESETPDWLKGQDESDTPDPFATPSSDAPETPDWLKDAQADSAPAVPGTTPEPSIDSPAETKPETQTTEQETEAVPDWLQAANIDAPTKEEEVADTSQPETTEKIQSEPATQTSQDTSSDTPDWLKGQDESDTPDPFAAPSSDAPETPDWLQSPAEPASTPSIFGDAPASQSESVSASETTEPEDIATLEPGNAETPAESKEEDLAENGKLQTDINLPKYRAKDGTDLTTLPDIYAIVPHKDGDHKLVYFEEDAPEGLIDNEKKGKKGGAYKKGKMKIYDMHVDMKLHPSLKQKKGKPMDVWLIEDKEELDKQLQAIKKGKGGGLKFEKPHVVTLKEQKRKLGNEPEDKSEEKVQDQESISESKSENVSTPEAKEQDVVTKSPALGVKTEEPAEESKQDLVKEEEKVQEQEKDPTPETKEQYVVAEAPTPEAKVEEQESTSQSESVSKNEDIENGKPKTENSTENPADKDDDLPDWLKGDIDTSATTQFTDDLKKMEEERQKEIEKLQKEQGIEPEAKTEEKVQDQESISESKSENVSTPEAKEQDVVAEAPAPETKTEDQVQESASQNENAETLELGNTEAPSESKEEKTIENDTMPKLHAKDGTKLQDIPDVYAILPHKDGDHKIIFKRGTEPAGLLNDPQGRIKGSQYKKGNLKIYDVHVDMKEHPTLKSKDRDLVDVWIIDTPDNLEKQIQSIKDGKGGGTKFGEVIIVNDEIWNEAKVESTSQSESVSKKEDAENGKPKTENSTENPADKDDDLPDWLKGDIDSSATTQFTDDLKKMEEERQKEIEQLQKEQGIEPEAKTEEKVQDEEKVSESKSENVSTPETKEQDVVAEAPSPEAKVEEQESTSQSESVSTSETAESENTETLELGKTTTSTEIKEEKVEEKPVENPADKDDDLPDWLKGDIDTSATTQFTDDLKKMEEERQKEIEQLQKEQGIEPEKKNDESNTSKS